MDKKSNQGFPFDNGEPKPQPPRKRTPSRNALKQGFFSRELNLTEQDKCIFQTLRAALQKQLDPKTPMQWIAFDRVVICAWRCRLALTMETSRLDQLNNSSRRAPDNGDALPDPHSLRWFGVSARELNAGLRILQDVRADICETGMVPERWRETLTPLFGVNFYDLLRNWSHIGVEALQLTNALMAHAKNFNMPLKDLEMGTQEGTLYLRDPHQEQQMLLKLIDLQVGFLNDVRRITGQRSWERQADGSINLEFTRYFPEASRALEKAVAWFQDLEEQGL